MNPTTVKFNFFSAEFHANPYPTYAQLRQEDPIHWSFLQAWMITRFADVETLLKDRRFQVSELEFRLRKKSQYLRQANLNVLAEMIEHWLFFVEPPHHTRLRGLVSKAFSLAAIEAMRPEIQDIADQLIAAVIPLRQMDVIQDLAAPLSARILARMLGLPVADFDKLMQWSSEFFFTFDQESSFVFDQPMPLVGYQKQNQIAQEAKAYFSDCIAQQKMHPNDGLISRLIAVSENGTQLRVEEILAFCLMLLAAGLESTHRLTGNAILALLQHPEALAELKQHPEQIQAAIEELLRYDSPAQMITRLATEPIEIGGKTIRTGERVIFLLGAANHDPAQFAEPNRLVFHRQNSNLSFGSGFHYCLGAALARIQAQIAVLSLVQQLQNPTLDTASLEWGKKIAVRGLKKLPIQFEA